MAADQAVLMNIPKEMVDAHVRAAMVQVLARDPEALVRAVVDAAMNQKVNSYDRETIWERQLNELLRNEATAAAREWLAEQAPKVRAAIRKRMEAEKSKFVADLCNRLADAVTKAHVNVTLGRE